ncbi:MAG TPA: hypothetical protein VK149_02305 [Sideroxyarcus sp.]|nr:hypothetical protein [Sideroxyarcus sp.]
MLVTNEKAYMRKILLTCMLTMLAAPVAHGADQLTTFKFDPGTLSSNMTPQPVGCSFPSGSLPAKFVVFATGAYTGKVTDFQIDQSGHQATKVDVVVNYTDSPVVLMLGAYEPTIWNIGWSDKTRIVAVFASGYHRQVLAGIPESVPYFISTYDNKAGCGSSYITAENPAGFDALSRKLFNRPVETVYPISNGTALMGLPIKPGMRLLTSSTNTVESYYDKDAPLAGPAGIKDAVAKGLLRPAALEDMQAWMALMKEKAAQETAAKPAQAEPVAGAMQPAAAPPRRLNVPSNSYVVLKAFTFPAGLYGGNSATFFVPKGTASPAGNPGHSTVFDFNTNTCTGPSCSYYTMTR